MKKAQFIEVIEKLVELRNLIEYETREGNIGPRALEIADELLNLHRRPLDFNILSEKAKLGTLHHAKNLLDNAAKENEE